MKIRAGSPSLYLTAGEARGQVPPDNMSCGAAMSFVPYYYIAAPQLTREFHAAIHGLAPVVIDNLVPSALHPSPTAHHHLTIIVHHPPPGAPWSAPTELVIKCLQYTSERLNNSTALSSPAGADMWWHTVSTGGKHPQLIRCQPLRGEHCWLLYPGWPPLKNVARSAQQAGRSVIGRG